MSREEALENIRNAIWPLAGPYGDITITGVDVKGRCANDLVQAHIQPLFEARTVDELVNSFGTVQSTLYGLGIFDDVAISMTPEKVVTVSLPPVKRYALGLGSNFSQHEGSGYIRGSITNKTGWGEYLSLDVSTGTRTKAAHMFRAAIPLPFKDFVLWKAETLFYSSEKIAEWASSKAYIKGISARFTKTNGTSFGVDAVLRTLCSQKLYMNNYVRQATGESFKLSLFYNWRYDNRVLTDRFPGNGKGIMVDLKSELGIPPTTSPFFKLTALFESAFDLFYDVTGSFNTKLGFIVPNNKAQPINFLDKFHLGGPLDVRGFRFNHLGPHDSEDAIGGDILAASGFSVFSPIPRASPNLKLHNFINIGYLGTSFCPTQILRPSVSTGIGLCYSSRQARFELNINMPLVNRVGELSQKGLQLGVGLEFL